MLQIFNQGMAALQGKRDTFSREFIQWLRGLVFVANVGPVPPLGIVWANLSAGDITTYFTSGLGNVGMAYEGWAICNGSNGTPNLADRFVRAKVTGAGATGGSDTLAHTHAIDHDHGSFTSGSHTLTTSEIPSHTHGVGTLAAANESTHTHQGLVVGGTIPVVMDAAAGATRRTLTYTAADNTGNAIVTAAGDAHTHSLSGSTASAGTDGGHTHAVDPPSLTGTSGAASNTENRPAYYELVPLMRVWS